VSGTPYTCVVLISAMLMSGCGRREAEHTSRKPVFPAPHARAVTDTALTHALGVTATGDLAAVVYKAVAKYADLLHDQMPHLTGTHIPGIDQRCIEHLRVEQAWTAFLTATNQRGGLAHAIAAWCRNYEAGTVFLSNYYYALHHDPEAALILGRLWGEFAMRHGRAADAAQIYEQALRDGQALPLKEDNAGAMALLLQARVELYNLSRAFEQSAAAARAYHDWVTAHSSFFPPAARAHYVHTAAALYVQELCNNGQFGEAAHFLDAHPDYEVPEGVRQRVRQRNEKYQSILSQGFGVLAK